MSTDPATEPVLPRLYLSDLFACVLMLGGTLTAARLIYPDCLERDHGVPLGLVMVCSSYLAVTVMICSALNFGRARRILVLVIIHVVISTFLITHLPEMSNRAYPRHTI